MRKPYKEIKKQPLGRKKIISETIIERMKELYIEGYSVKELSEMYFVCEKTIRNYLKGTKRNVGRRPNKIKDNLKLNKRRK